MFAKWLAAVLVEVKVGSLCPGQEILSEEETTSK